MIKKSMMSDSVPTVLMCLLVVAQMAAFGCLTYEAWSIARLSMNRPKKMKS
ncbi:hypothetical protein EMPG_14226 [Blastomyces silverae]|uniref:Uncharacterized protein n=1 Tax=Blastomyces silverae TaxID=2060906 RepID=A0A0H1BH97_9EURO|nr:hypothetical protein EMPG_14226 [Blastomyces silverae]